MGTLIRSAQVASDARVLPLREELQHGVVPVIAPFPDPSPSMPITSEFAAKPINDSLEPDALRYEEIEEAPPPKLDPALKEALLAEIQAARDAAVQEGFEVGHAQGIAEANQSLQTQIDAVNHLLQTAKDALQSQIIGLEDVVVALAFETVCKIIGSTLHDRDGVVAVVREVIAHVKESEPIKIRVSPADYHQLANDQAALTQTYFASGITLIPDDRVILGGCLIETSGGSLDGRLETQLQQVKDALLSARRQRADWKETPHAV